MILGTFKIEHVLSLIKDCKWGLRLNGYSVWLGPHARERFQVFLEKGVVCASCGMVGSYFILEELRDGLQLHLYGYHNGKRVRMTKDHIIPVSAGGKSEMDNYQPMCLDCNKEKGSRHIGVVEASTLTGLRHGRKKVGTAYELLTEYAELPEDGSVEYFRGETMVLFKPKVGGVFCVCEAGERGWVLKRVVGELNDIKWKKTNSGECK